MSAILSGDFTSFKHIKTRKAFVIEIEFPEEMGQEVLRVLGMPIGGESKPVAVALLNPTIKESLTVEQSANNAQSSCTEKSDNSEGDNLRIRAVMLCKDKLFHYYIVREGALFPSTSYRGNEEAARQAILDFCYIKSRSELAINQNAQTKFQALLIKFESWKLENQYADNLNRI